MAAVAILLSYVVTLGRASDVFLEREGHAIQTRHDEKRHHGAHFRAEDPGDGFVKGLRFKHRLRVCNAYPNAMAMDVFRGKDKLTGQEPLQYKTCREFRCPLLSGDRLEFTVGDANAGTFSVSDLPNNDAVLFLVVLRHDTLSTAVSFESHVFANLLNAQVAIIDTFKGQVPAKPRIMDSAAAASGKSRSEQLRFNSVVAVNPGVYEVELDDPKDGKEKVKHELVALDRESYVVLRTGVEAEQGPQYPQELVIFPQSDPSALHGRAHSVACNLAILLSVAVATVAVL
jgi:hypothetical protein